MEADISKVPVKPVKKLKGSGKFVYLEYEFVFQFSAVEMKAWLSWNEKVSIHTV